MVNSLLSKLKGHIRVVIRREPASIFYGIHRHKHIHRHDFHYCRMCTYMIYGSTGIFVHVTLTRIEGFSPTRHNSPLCTSSISNSPPPVFTTLMFAVMFSVHNSSSGVKLMLPHQEESTNNNQTLFPPLPTLFTTGSVRLSLCSHAPSLLFSPLCIVLCPQVRGSLCFLL